MSRLSLIMLAICRVFIKSAICNHEAYHIKWQQFDLPYLPYKMYRCIKLNFVTQAKSFADFVRLKGWVFC